ncbi:hypothetical protein GCM10027055_28820 [Janibacter alkaliphilus]
MVLLRGAVLLGAGWRVSELRSGVTAGGSTPSSSGAGSTVVGGSGGGTAPGELSCSSRVLDGALLDDEVLVAELVEVDDGLVAAPDPSSSGPLIAPRVIATAAAAATSAPAASTIVRPVQATAPPPEPGPPDEPPDAPPAPPVIVATHSVAENSTSPARSAKSSRSCCSMSRSFTAGHPAPGAGRSRGWRWPARC